MNKVKAIIDECNKHRWSVVHPEEGEKEGYWNAIHIGKLEHILTEQLGECGELLWWKERCNVLTDRIKIAERIIKNTAQPESELKEWQVLTGKFASMANSLANILISGKVRSIFKSLVEIWPLND